MFAFKRSTGSHLVFMQAGHRAGYEEAMRFAPKLLAATKTLT